MNDRFQRIRHSQRARQAIPNLLTLGNLVSGALALGVILNEGPMWQAFALIFVALLCDLFDGRAARALGTDGPMGAQLDSLADLISFGLVPAAALYTWSLSSMGALGVVVCCAWVAAAAWRLARFTVAALLPPEREATEHSPGPASFQGLPVPIPAAIVLGAAGAELALSPLLVALVAFALAGLMVSTVPFRSFKDGSLAPFMLPVLLVAVACVLSTGSLLTGVGCAVVVTGITFVSGGALDALSSRAR